MAFDVPLSSRYCTPYLFGVVRMGWPTPVESRRVIRVMKGDKMVGKMSANDIARLEVDADGYRIWRSER